MCCHLPTLAVIWTENSDPLVHSFADRGIAILEFRLLLGETVISSLYSWVQLRR